MYKGYLNGELFWRTDIDDEGYKIIDPSLSLSAGTAGSLVFTLPYDNIKYTGFSRLVDYVDIYRDSEIIFSGRVFDDTLNFDKTRKISCEGIMAVLNDSIFRPTTYRGTLANLVQSIISNHNSQVSADKRIYIGNLQVSDDNVYREYENYESSMSRLTDLVNSYGGYLFVYRSGNAIYLDWEENFDRASSQTIDLGMNLLDITQSQSAEDITTVLIPLGAEFEKTDGTRERLTIKSVNNNLDYLEDSDGIAEFGIIVKVAIWDDVTEASNLMVKGRQFLDEASKSKVTITLDAVDLSDAGYSVDHFSIRQRIHVKSKAHNIDDMFEVKNIKLDLLNPTSNTLTLGSETYGYISAISKANSKYTNIIEHVYANYALNKDLKAVSVLTEEHTTSIQQNHEAIELRATKTYVDGEIANAKSYADTKKTEAQNYADSVLADFESGDFATAIGNLQDQIDGNIMSWFYDYAPTTSNVPASNWTTISDKLNHLGDLFYQGDTGYCYRWQLKTTADPEHPTANDFEWVQLTDDAISQALSIAQNAKDTADNKRRVFVVQPYPPYDVGDLWSDGDDLRVCTHARATGSFTAPDWVLATNYIDIDDVVIGGRNLIQQLDTVDLSATSKRPNINGDKETGYLYSTKIDVTEAKKHGARYTADVATRPYLAFGNNNVSTISKHGFLEGDTLTISFDWKAKLYSGNTLNGTPTLRIYLRKLVNGESSVAVDQSKILHTFNNDDRSDRGVEIEGRCEWTFTIPENIKGFNFLFSTSTATASYFGVGDYVEMTNIKLERGNKATDWTPAPEDIQLSLDNLNEVLQSQIDQKIQTWYQSADPSASWEDKETHDGDLWCYTGDTTTTRIKNATYIYDYNSDSWKDYSATKELFDNVDAKTTIYYGTPQPPYPVDVELGDYLVDEEDGSSYRWNGSQWISVSDYATAILNTEITGLGWKVNYSTLTTHNTGECCYYGYNRKNEPAEVNGWVYWNGERVSIPFGYWIKPNRTMPYNTLIYSVYRYNADGTQGTFHDVCYLESTNKWYANTYTPISSNKGGTPSARTEWTWNEETDIILAMYIEPSDEGAITNAQLFSPPKKFGELQERGYSALLTSLLNIEDELQDQIDQKIQTWCQATNPASSWIASERPAHENDLWYYTGITPIEIGSITVQPTGTYRYTKSGNNYAWTEYAVSDLLFDTVDRKASIYYGTTSSIVPSQGYTLEDGDYLVNTADGSTYRWLAQSNSWVTVSDFADAIDKIQIGGRNLLPDTDAPSLEKVAGKSSRAFTNSTTISENGQGTEFVARADDIALADCPANITNGVKFVCTATGGLHHMLRFYNGDGRLTFENGETYTASMWVKGSVVDAQVGITISDVANVIETSDQRLVRIETANKWTKYKFTFKYIGATGQAFIYYGFTYNIVGTVYCCAFKLEKGTKATDWTLAPEDVEEDYKNNISNVQQSLQGQIDDKIETWRQQTSPSLVWTTAEERAKHDGDLWLYTGTTTSALTKNAIYRYDGENDSWQDYSATDDLFNAIGTKMSIYYGDPETSRTGLNEGDYLVDNRTNKGQTYRWSGSDWVLATDYAGAIATYKSSVDADLKVMADNITSTVTRVEYVEGNVNLLPYIYYDEYMSGNPYEYNSLTFTVNADGSVTVNGTASNDTYYYLTGKTITDQVPCVTIDENKLYSIHGCPAGGSSNTYYIRGGFFRPNQNPSASGGAYFYDYGTGTHTSNKLYNHVVICIVIKKNYTANNLKFYPMLETGTTVHSYVSSRDGTGAIFNRVVSAESRITQTERDITSKVSAGDVESIIKQQADSIRLKANKIAWSSANSSMTEDGILSCTGANISGDLTSKKEVVESGVTKSYESEIGSIFYTSNRYGAITYKEGNGFSVSYLNEGSIISQFAVIPTDNYILESLQIPHHATRQYTFGTYKSSSAKVVIERYLENYHQIVFYGSGYQNGSDATFHVGHNMILWQAYSDDFSDGDDLPATGFPGNSHDSFCVNDTWGINVNSVNGKKISLTLKEADVSISARKIETPRAGSTIIDYVCGMKAGNYYISVLSNDPNNRSVKIQGGSGTSNGVTFSDFFYIRYGVGYIDSKQLQVASTSSKRYKKNIGLMTNEEFDPHRLYLLKAKQFMYNYDAPLQYKDMKGKMLCGFIAEDVAEIYPTAVIHDENGNIESWDERRIIPAMLALIQEQNERIKALEVKNG